MGSTSWKGSVPAAIRIECPDGVEGGILITDIFTDETVVGIVRLKLELIPSSSVATTADVWFMQHDPENGRTRLVGPRRVRACLGRPFAVVEPPKPKTFIERMFRS